MAEEGKKTGVEVMVSGLKDVQEPWSRTWGENVTKPSLPATNSGKEEVSSNLGSPLGILDKAEA